MLILPPTPEHIARAAETLAEGRLVAFPTETVYGLGGDARNEDAVCAIYAAKGRPAHNPLIVHVANGDMARYYGSFNRDAQILAAAFWPGPLTLVIPRRTDAPLTKTLCRLDTIALRVPAHPVAAALLANFGQGIAAPSANRSGRISPTKAAHVGEEFTENHPALAFILDGGACERGIESTVVACLGDGPRILRPGSITADAIGKHLPHLCEAATPDPASPLAPGQLESHYAPRLPVRLNAAAPRPGEAFLAFGPTDAHGPQMRNLSEQGNPEEAAAHLYDMLRILDTPEYSAIAVMPIPTDGIGAAINDRLRRAAALCEE